MVHRPRQAQPIDLTRCFAASDRQAALSRRSQALLAAAGMAEPARHWCVATVAPGMDATAAETMALSGIECWLPHVLVKPRRRPGRPGPRGHVQTRLAFPGYLFVRVAATADAWAGIASVKGVAGLLGQCGRPETVPDHLVALFRAYLADDPAAIDILTNAVKPGDAVVVRDGPFAELPGRVEAIDRRGRALVDILIFGRSTGVNLDLAQLAKL